jgi:hypothetical protein
MNEWQINCLLCIIGSGRDDEPDPDGVGLILVLAVVNPQRLLGPAFQPPGGRP